MNSPDENTYDGNRYDADRADTSQGTPDIKRALLNAKPSWQKDGMPFSKPRDPIAERTPKNEPAPDPAPPASPESQNGLVVPRIYGADLDDFTEVLVSGCLNGVPAQGTALYSVPPAPV